MLVDFLSEDNFYIKIDIIEIDRLIKLSVDIKKIFYGSDIIYNDALWFEEDVINQFIKNINIDKKANLFDADNDFSLLLDNNYLIISINKSTVYDKSKFVAHFEVCVKDNLYLLKEEFNKLQYLI
jgi:hypothetical protein